jgi:hypothetical protein
MPENFSIKKLLDFSPIGFYKVIGLSIKAGVIVLVIFGVLWIKNILFPAPSSNVNQPEIHVATGGTLNYAVTQQAEKKRAWWIPGPFVELFGQMDSDSGKDVTVGTRFGARWEF